MLTDAEIRAAVPGKTVRELRDGDGLALRVTPGGHKAWTLRFRTTAGDRRRMALGDYGERAPGLSLKAARREARKILGLVAAGRDPVAEAATDREALRMRDLFGEPASADGSRPEKPGWYLGEYVRTAGQNGHAKSARSIQTDRYYVRGHLWAHHRLMAKRVDAVTLADLNAIKAEAKPGAWRKVRDILRIGFRHGQGLGALPFGPTVADKTTKTADKRCDRYLTPEERRRLGEYLTRAEGLGPRVTGGLSPATVRLFRLLLLTGMRLGEALDLRWEQVDFAHGLLRLPASKTGAKQVPISPQAVAFLLAEKGDLGRLGLVCPSDDGNRLGNVERSWRAVRKHADLEGLRIHDLRHSWASDAASSGVPLAVIGQVLGHKSTATTARYAHLTDEALRQGLELTGNAIERATREGR